MSLMNDFLKDSKHYKNQGRCLHFDAGERCDQIINAHSIQKGNLLKPIAENGHVFRINADIGLLKRNNGRLEATKFGINKVSTFLGFCKTHDNELFAPIDNAPLLPNDVQIFLYAYRSLCREVFVKENASNVLKNRLKVDGLPNHIRDFTSDTYKAVESGLRSLLLHKQAFDKSLENSAYNDIRYVAFQSDDSLSIVFSGLRYPDIDFFGNYVQDFFELNSKLELITYFSAPTDRGWAFVFAWHKSSNIICEHYMKSLATHISEGGNISDILFRYLFSCCENHSISPSWWDRLKDNDKERIYDSFTSMTHPTTPLPEDYLRVGLEGISDWNFTKIASNVMP